ncbi:peptidoglycan bridge formation glycyltransferase FemA/FemB family protein [Candidatus Saccharibacteria bacterium]|nr:peptidoglycan bridge formation glycyltransferase FemA/FemB family protein [Candidatus Saccharibacteria bacterium]
MPIRFASADEVSRWNDLIITNPDGGNVFSSYEFAIQKETGGYKAHFLMADDLAITALEKSAPGLGKFWYLPKGPNITSDKALFSVLKNLGPFAKRQGVFAIRTEPELNRSLQPSLQDHGMFKARPIIPNPSTITLDITPGLDTILTNLPQKGRYAIKRAEREGAQVKLVKSTDDNCRIMYKLLADTAEGQFGIRSFKYFQAFWQRFETAGSGQLFFAYYDDQVVAGAYAMVYGKKSTYKDGASIRKRTVYGASHLLQWEVVKWAKSHGATLHDFCGSPPSDEIDNPDHKLHGVGLFKTGFSKNVVDYVGCYDFVISPTKYKIWIKFAEKVAHRIHYYRHHDSYY